MTKQVCALVVALGLAVPLTAVAEDALVRFKGGIGVIPVSSGVGQDATAETVTRNIVRTVQPPGQVWRIADLRATVERDGHLRVTGRGLLLAGGNNIGTNAGQSVFATLICGAAPALTFHSSDSAGVPLEPDGDFHIDDTLDPTVPDACVSPVLLIRSTAGPQAWFAAGIPKP
jgi:hypothetical protein